MAAYMIITRTSPVRDQAAMDEYQRLNRESKHQFKIKPLVMYGAMEALEGDAPDGALVLEFPDMDEAKAWYNSPDYAASRVFRKKAADYNVFIVEGFVYPQG